MNSPATTPPPGSPETNGLSATKKYRLPELLLPLLFAAVLFFTGLGQLPLLEPDEGRNAEVAREMVETGDWVTPHYNNLTYLDKPPVYFWMVASSFTLFGSSEWSARLPGALLGLATVLLAWLWGRRAEEKGKGNGRRGVTAALILASTPFMMVFSRIVIFDMTLHFLVSLSLISFWFLQRSAFRSLRHTLLFFGSMGIATITKGPVGFLLPWLTVLAYLGFSGRLSELKRLRWAVGPAIFMAATLPWFLAVSWENPDFPRYAFWNESLMRFTTGSARRSGPLYYYLPVFLFGFLPWSLFLVTGYAGRLRAWRKLRDEENRNALFLLCWTAVVFVFFSISRSKLPGYLLPAFTPLSLLTAKLWSEWPARDHSSESPAWTRRGFWALGILGLLMAAVPWIHRMTPQQNALAEKVGPLLAGQLGATLISWGLILAALSVLGRHMSHRPQGSHLTLLLLLLAFPLMLVRGWPTLQTYAASNSSKALAEKIETSPYAGNPVYGYYCFRTGLGFYLRRPVHVITTGGSELTSNYIVSRLEEFLEKPGTTLHRLEHVAWLAKTNSKPLLILSRHENISSMLQALPRAEPLRQDWKYQDWTYSVWRVPPAELRP